MLQVERTYSYPALLEYLCNEEWLESNYESFSDKSAIVKFDSQFQEHLWSCSAVFTFNIESHY